MNLNFVNAMIVLLVSGDFIYDLGAAHYGVPIGFMVISAITQIVAAIILAVLAKASLQ